MKKKVNLFTDAAIGAYLIKFVVDLVMYLFMKNEMNNEYLDVWYLYMPQVVSTVLLVGFYFVFLTKYFEGAFIKISTIVMISINVIFIVLLYFDMGIGYIFYFALIAVMNFLNGLFIKCNVIPVQKTGSMEYIPLIFEFVPFVCMVMSAYATFCGFPTLISEETFTYWDYYNVHHTVKLNIVSEFILCFTYVLCRLNNSEFVRDNMAYEDYFE